MEMSLIFVMTLAGLTSALTTERPCEDAPIDCASLPSVCKDPIDSVAYCPRHCGVCTGPTPAPVCRDFDKGCPVLANTNYCQLDIASELCPKSCGFCSEPTTTTEATTTLGYTMIPDPACQDVDPDCITLLQIHYCGQEDIVRRLCQRSCDLCPLIQVPITATPVTATPVPGVTTDSPTVRPTTAKVCMNNDPICDDPGTADNCSTNDLIQRLCPVTCSICTPQSAGSTSHPQTAGVTNEETTDSGVTDGGVTDGGVTDGGVTDGGVTDGGVTDGGVTDGGVTDGGVTDDGVTDDNVTSEPPAAGSTTTLKPVPTLKPFTPSANCVDRDPQCNFLIRSFYCSNNQLVRRICPRSCELCAGPTLAPGETSPAAGATTPGGPGVTTGGVATCEDIDSECPSLLEFCNRDDTLVNRLCRKSCGFCGVDLTVPPPRPGLSQPLQCHICVEPFCDKNVESVRLCPTDAPYCVSQIHNRQDGTRGLTRRCAAKRECDQRYLGQTSADTRCQGYDLNVFVKDEFECFFCCVTDDCNIPAVPVQDSLYRA